MAYNDSLMRQLMYGYDPSPVAPSPQQQPLDNPSPQFLIMAPRNSGGIPGMGGGYAQRQNPNQSSGASGTGGMGGMLNALKFFQGSGNTGNTNPGSGLLTNANGLFGTAGGPAGSNIQWNQPAGGAWNQGTMLGDDYGLTGSGGAIQWMPTDYGSGTMLGDDYGLMSGAASSGAADSGGLLSGLFSDGSWLGSLFA